MNLRRSLGTLALVFVMYFNTSGGPFTTEALVTEVGPGLALALLVAIPILWALPEALIVAELASMMPVEGGYYKWVQRAFGERLAFVNGWITWMYSLVDMALYPLLFIQYLKYFVPDLAGSNEWLVALAVIWGATIINLRGAARVGVTSIIAGLFIIATFLFLTLAALPNATHEPWKPFMLPGSTPWSGLALGMSIALWNYIGWDNASTVQGEVKDASDAYPRALSITLPLATAGCVLPLAATLAASDWTTWTDGGWPQIALDSAGAAGPILAPMLAIGGMVSAIALFNALLMVYTRIPFVMALDGLLPAALGRTDDRGTPRNAIWSAAIFYSVIVLIPFGHLLIADVLLYAFALMLEFLALIALRRKEPGLRGSFRIPVSRGGVIALAALPMAILIAVIVISFMDGEYGFHALAGATVVVATGFLVYAVIDRSRSVVR